MSFGKGSNTTTTSSSSSPNPQALAAYQSLLSRAGDVASTPYQGYSGELVAPVNAQQNLGISGINANAGFAQPYMVNAANYANAAATPLSTADIQQYINPYTQNVINATQAQFANSNAEQQSQLVGNAAAQNALGGDRVAVAQAELARQQNLAQNPVIAGLYSQGYNSAVNTALAAKSQQASNAGALAGVASAGQNAALSGAGAQIGAGTLEQQTQQAQDVAAYQQFLRQQAFPYQQTQWLAGIDTGVGSQMGGTNQGQTTGPAPSVLGQVAGLGLAGVGLIGGTGGFGSTGWLKGMFAKHGGRIKGFAPGGTVMPYSDSGSIIPEIAIVHGRGAPEGHMAAAPAVANQNPLSLYKDATSLGGSLKDVFGTFGSFRPGALGTPGNSMTSGSGGFLGSAGDPTGGGLVETPAKHGGAIRGYDDGGVVDDTPVRAGFGMGSFVPNFDERYAGVAPTIDKALMASLEPDRALPPAASGVASDVPMPIPRPEMGVAQPPQPTEGVAVTEAPVLRAGVGASAPRGIRNNNPGNIEDGPFARSQPGYVGSDGRFAVFETQEQGQRAASSLLNSYNQRGINTISGIVNRWAPAADGNDTAAYISAVSKATGLDPNQPLDMNDPEIRTKVASAIFSHENGIPGIHNDLTTRNYNRSYGAEDGAIPRAAAPVQYTPKETGLGAVPSDVWTALTAAGLGMMASKSPFPGVAIGEGGLQGVGTYLQQQQLQTQQGQSQQRIDLEAKRLQQEADRWQKNYELHSKPYTGTSKVTIPSAIPGEAGQTIEVPGTLTGKERFDLAYKVAEYQLQQFKANADRNKPFVYTDIDSGRQYMFVPQRSPKGETEWVLTDPKNAQPNVPIGKGLPGAPNSAPNGNQQQGPQSQANSGFQTVQFNPDKEGLVQYNDRIQELAKTEGGVDYAHGAPYIEKGMDVPAPKPVAGKSVESIKTDAENYLQTGKLPPTRGGQSPIAIQQQNYQNAVKNYANALASSRGFTPEQMVDAWRSAPGMLRFVLGADGRATVSLGTAVRHLDTLAEYAKAWNAGAPQTLNKIKATLSREFGGTSATNLESVAHIVGPEIIKAIGVAGAGTADEREAIIKQFTTARSYDQVMQAVIATQKLLGGQLEGRKRQASAAGVSEAKFKGLVGDRPFEILSHIDKGGNNALTRPSLETFMEAAKPKNPNATDKELTDYYNKEYGQ